MEKIFLAPYNKPAKALAEILHKKHGLNVMFIDSHKHDNLTIFHPENLTNLKIDKIVIVSTNFYEEIYQILLKNKMIKNKIYFYDSIYKLYFTSSFFYKYFLLFQRILNKFTLFISSLKLKKYKNKHLNQRCFILGNGPSLTINDLNKLTNEITFASNKIYLGFDATIWRPNYYFVEDHLVLQQNYETIKHLHGFQKFFPNISLKWAPKVRSGIYYNLIYDFEKTHFSDDPIKGFYWGATVTYSMIQMAAYMGFKEIYLLGIDFNFIGSSHKIAIGDTGVFVSTGEQNHFHKDYRAQGEQWTVPDTAFQEKAFKTAQKYASTKNISIFNSSRKTQLTIFSLKVFDDLFPSS